MRRLIRYVENVKSDKIAVTFYDEKCTKRITFGELVNVYEKIKSFFSVLDHTTGCIGLLIEKNIYTPSLIICLQSLDYAFMFLTADNLRTATEFLNFTWIICSNDQCGLENFILERKLVLDDDITFWLWKNETSNCKISFEDIFCVMLTSGSTGDNKFVRIPYSCIMPNASSLGSIFSVCQKDIIFWGTPLTFDPSLVEFLLAMLCGAQLLITSQKIFLNPNSLHHILSEEATVVQMVPSVFLRWNEYQIHDILNNSKLRVLAFGGEPFPQEILKYKRYQNIKLFNLYGITELSCWASVHEISTENNTPIGIPLSETYLNVINEKSEIITEGVGEICIGSATRYCLLNDQQKQDVVMPLKTGDIAEIKDSKVFYKGRKNRMIKRFGQKVDLSYIESLILTETGLSNRLVFSNQHKKLLAFILVPEKQNADTKNKMLDKLRVKLLKTLPSKDFPDYIGIVFKFPLSAHGKIHDKALENQYKPTLSKALNPIELFKSLCCNCIGVSNFKQIEKYTFSDLGVSSMLVTHFMSEFEFQMEQSLPPQLLRLIFNEPLFWCLKFLQENSLSLKRKKPPDLLPNAKCIRTDMDIRWKFDLKACADCSPVAFESGGQTLIATGSFAHIFAIVNELGQEYMALALPNAIEATPSISNCKNLIFVGCFNGLMYCINLSKKQIDWEYQTGDKIKCTPCICRENTAIAFGSYDNSVYCLGAENGKLFWKTVVMGGICTNPLLNGGRIYVSTLKGMCYCLNEDNGDILWCYEAKNPLFGSHCFLGDSLLWPDVNGTLHCLSVTGHLKWKQEISGHIFSNLVAINNKVYFGSQDANVYELTVSDGCKTCRKFTLHSDISSTPFYYKNLLICVCNSGVLYSINLDTSEVLTLGHLPSQSFSSPYVYKNKIYVGCRDNNLYCVNLNVTTQQRDSLD